MSEQFFAKPTATLSSSSNPRRMLRRNSEPGQGLDIMIGQPSVLANPSPLLSKKEGGLPQSPFPSPSQSQHPPQPSPTSSTSTARRTQQHRLNAAQEQRAYQDSRNRLMNYVSSAVSICNDLRDVNKQRFPIQYPALRRLEQPLSYMDPKLDEALETSSVPDAAPSPVLSAVVKQNKSGFNILNLDIKVGHNETDIHALEKQSIATLLDDKLGKTVQHLHKLRNRVADTSSKVLVTGDLNAGKSTFVNALLKRDLLPADQQPCTSMFCEVLDATLNDGIEQVHAIPDVEAYDRANPDTYHVVELRHLYKIITDEQEQYKMLKVYASDTRSAQESLLHNGVVDIALIDSPGLNTDSVKTTAVFARQEEIDVVVFVVSAENHFTLSVSHYPGYPHKKRKKIYHDTN